MKRIITLLPILFIINKAALAQCNPAFTFTSNQSVVSFTGTATQPSLLHYWNFGDGYSGSGRVTSHSYNNPGTYNVKHIIYDSLNTCVDSLTQSVTVNFTATCQASFYAQYDSITYSYGIYCYSTSTYSGAGIQNYTWTVNGVVQAGNGGYFYFNPSPGLNTVCLNILTNAGCTSSYCQAFNVPASCNFNPSFTYAADPSDGHKISFTPSPNQANLNYIWQFGDGYTSTTRLPVHIYYGTGVYSVKLIVRDPVANCLDTVRQSVVVSAGPGDSCTASFSYSLNNYGLASFTAYSNQPITSQDWFIYRYSTGDSIHIVANNLIYQFPDTGHYNVCLTLTTNTGCRRTYCTNIYVFSVSGRYAETIPAFPNPVSSGIISMNVNLGRTGHIDIRVIDINGNTVYQTRTFGQGGANIVKIPVDKLNRGQYFVEICYGYKVLQSIFQKL